MFTWKDTDGFIHGVAFDAIEVIDQENEGTMLGMKSNNTVIIPTSRHQAFMDAYKDWSRASWGNH